MANNVADLPDASAILDLQKIRSTLMRMEDSIVFSLIERSQYPSNSAVYVGDNSQLSKCLVHQLKSVGSNGSLGDYFLYQTECLHAQIGRYLHPTEYPFHRPLPDASLGFAEGRASRAQILAPVPPEAILTRRLLETYRTKILPRICEEGDDKNYGSTAVQDVHCLQTMSTRIHYGLLVAESKFRSENERARRLIENQDREGLMDFITKTDVEEKNIKRVVLKAQSFCQNIEHGDVTPGATTYKFDPVFMGTVFREWLMPLTKEVEVEYLLQRLNCGENLVSAPEKRPRRK